MGLAMCLVPSFLAAGRGICLTAGGDTDVPHVGRALVLAALVLAALVSLDTLS